MVTRPADRMRKKQPLTQQVTVVLDDTKAAALADALDALGAAEQRLHTSRPRMLARLGEADLVDQAVDEELAPLREAVARARADLEKHTQTYMFRGLGRRAFRELQAQHPPTDDDREQAKAEGLDGAPTYHVESFAPALIAASCVSPTLSDTDVQFIFDTWTEAEISELFMAALWVNTARRVIPQ